MNIFSMLLGKQYNILTYLPEAVLVIDEQGKILYANKDTTKRIEALCSSNLFFSSKNET